MTMPCCRFSRQLEWEKCPIAVCPEHNALLDNLLVYARYYKGKSIVSAR